MLQSHLWLDSLNWDTSEEIHKYWYFLFKNPVCSDLISTLAKEPEWPSDPWICQSIMLIER